MILAAMHTLLSANAGVTALVGTKIFPTALPQGESTPALDMRTISRGGEQVLTGGVRLYRTEVIFDCYADDDPAKADSIAFAVLDALVGYQGTSQGTHIRSVTIEDTPSLSYESPDPGSSRLRAVSSCSVAIAWAVAN